MINLRLIYEYKDYLNDVQDIPRAFSPYINIDDNADNFLKWEYDYNGIEFSIKITSNLWEEEIETILVNNENLKEYKKVTKMFIKNSLYKYLSKVLQIKLPYGSLTGVRPTKLYYELSKKIEYPTKYIVEKYAVSQEKADLIADCVKNQSGYINTDEKSVGIFLNIPFCPTRCKYCSFISTEVFRIKKELPLYVECVRKDIETTLNIIEKNGYNVKSIYVGGGTPTSVGCSYLEAMIEPLKGRGIEFTVEAGRPETIDKETVELFKRCGVTRISINPQTFSDKTLELIGRNHTVNDVYRCFDIVKDSGLNVNTDLIAGLPGETYEDFVLSVNKCIELSPENVTIHTLSLKRGSVFFTDGMYKKEFGLVEKMINYGHNCLKTVGYLPYYMYRQKNTIGDLENVGYAKAGTFGVYNVLMMSDAHTVFSAGAGATTKLVKKTDGKIDIFRIFAPKYPYEYLQDNQNHKDEIVKFFK